MNARRLLLAVTMLNLLAARGSAEQLPSAAGRYLVTTTPIKITGISNTLCVGVDPTDAHGVWWWEPGQTGCSSRSTTDVIPAAGAAITARSEQAAIEINFRVPIHVGGPVDVDLSIRNGRMFASGSDVPGTGADVGVQIGRRDDLVLPESDRPLPRR